MLSNAYFLAKFRFDTAENEPATNLQNFAKFVNFALSPPNPNHRFGDALRLRRRPGERARLRRRREVGQLVRGARRGGVRRLRLRVVDLFRAKTRRSDGHGTTEAGRGRAPINFCREECSSGNVFWGGDIS